MTSAISSVTTHSPDRPKLRVQWWIPALLVVVLIATIMPRLLANTPTVPEITLVNRTKYAMHVQATDSARDGWTGMGTVERQDTTVVRDVVDQGSEWIFHFESQGVDGGEVRYGENDLVRSGWKVVIPESVGERLAGQGATPTPPPGY